MAFDQRESRTQPVGVTAPKEPLGFWASYRAVRRNVLELIPEQAYRQPVLTGGRRKGWMMLMDPPALERVFRGNVANYPKSPVARRLMTPREGENLIIAEGQSWRWQRRTMSPMFQPKALKAMSPVMSVAGASAADRIGAQDAEVVDVYPEVIAATCDVICDLALSGRDAINRAALTNAIEGYLRNIARVSLLDLLGAPSWVPRPGTLLNRDGPHMDRMTDEIIAARRARGPSDPPDILDMMLAANDPETGAEMDPVTMRNNLLGLLFAGHETTALAITWSLYLLALHQGAQDRARDEAQAAITGDPEAEIDPAKLGYARQVIEEALRLYPPAGFLTRTALEADELAGHEVKAGA
ncbi:MAG: cytochrome P450, partial [Pseudomonadota bacterium]